METLQNIAGQRLANMHKTETKLRDIQLPEEVEKLIDNKLYINRYKWLYSEYGAEWLLTVAKIANGIGKMPNRLFAKMCSKANESDTMATVSKYLAKAKAIKRVIQERPTVYIGRVYKHLKRLQPEVVDSWLSRSSDAEDPGKNFNWLLSSWLKTNA